MNWLYINTISSNHVEKPKYIKISDRERERLYEECFWEYPYIWYLPNEEITDRQEKQYADYIKTKNI
jgi:hypothetical protein